MKVECVLVLVVKGDGGENRMLRDNSVSKYLIVMVCGKFRSVKWNKVRQLHRLHTHFNEVSF